MSPEQAANGVKYPRISRPGQRIFEAGLGNPLQGMGARVAPSGLMVTREPFYV
jgi:hypothetical protein